MQRRFILPLGLALFTVCLSVAAQASDTCERYTGGKCRAGQKMPPRISSGAVTHQATQRPSTSNHKGREAYTPAERERFMEQARALCRKKHGAPSRVYRVDFKRLEVWCEPPSY